MMLSRLTALLSAVIVVSSQCSFNTLSINAGTNRFTGLTIAGAFGGGRLMVTPSGAAPTCQIHGTTPNGATCTVAKMTGAGVISYSTTVVATCTGTTYVYVPASATLVAENCAVNTGTATIATPHLFGETGTYVCGAGTSCSVAACQATCNAAVVAPAVNCNADCILGTQAGQLVTTTTVGSGGGDCSGANIAVAPFSPTCTVTQRPGYTCTATGGSGQNLPVTLTCTTAAATLITNACVENTCTPAANTIVGVIGDPTNSDQCGVANIALSVISDPSCDIRCDQSAGYIAQTGTYSCTNMAGGVPSVSSITACVPVPCPTNSNSVSLRNCVCDAGYTGVISYTGTAYSGTCTIINCNAYNFPTSPANIVAGATDGCTGNDILNVLDPTCNVQCAPGYVAATGVVTCDFAITRTSTTPLTCTEKTCSSYTFGTGITAGVSNGCTNPQVLRQATLSSCTLACAAGYTGVAGTLNCANTLATGSAPVVNIACTENTCAAYTLLTGEVATAPGCASLRTVTGNTCALTCATGYSTGAGTITCPATATPNQAPTVTTSPNCRRTCALHTCSAGFTPKTVLTTICNTAGCTDAVCCDAVACPANSNTAQTDSTLTPPSCVCMTGFSGTAAWDATGRRWTHACTAHCANTFFAGCDANSATLVANPSGTACTGTGNCNGGGCPACTVANCCQDNTCTAPGTTFPNEAFGGAQGNMCTTVSSCTPVTCNDGYMGTPILQCRTSGGAFTFNPACVASACPTFASPPGTCGCNAGYRVVGGGNTQFDRTSRSWTHTCELTCAHSTFTGCSPAGVTLIADPGNVVCTGTTGNPAVDCTTAVCCRQTCDNTGFACPTSGFSLRSNPSSIQCPAGGCDQATCCFATCDNTGFTGCTATGFTARPNPSSIQCGSNTLASCTTAICCLSTTCNTVTCPAGTRARSPVPTCAVCNEALCCVENSCTALTAGQFPNYIVAGGTACTTASGCNPTSCAAGFFGDPAAQLLCLTDGGTFTTTGCSENVCVATTLPAYSIATNPCTTVSLCGAVTCTPGYNSGTATPAVVCATNGGSLTGTGCVPNVCTPPGTAGIAGVTFSGPNTCTTVTACGTIACARGFDSTGTATITCLNAGGPFTRTGCRAKTCTQHLTNNVHAGYSVTIPTCTNVDQCGTVSCDIGYRQMTGATPAIVCPVTNGNFEYSGCEVVPCPTGASGVQCTCDIGFTGTPVWQASTNTWTHTCTMLNCPQFASGAGCPCQTGYTGTPAFSGTAWTHTCTIAACGPNQTGAPTCVCSTGYTGTPAWSGTAWSNACTAFTCSGGLSTNIDARYLIANRPCTTIASCGAVTCASGFVTNNPRLVCSSQNGLLTAVGCDVAACPTGAGPVGVCRCLNGYIGAPSPTFNGQVWSGVCSAQPCPANTNNVAGTCECLTGYIGNPQWSGTAWTHTCTISTCPANSGGAPNCVCNTGFSGTLTWSTVSDTWIGSCTTACPANSVRTNNICVCNTGYTGIVNGVGTACNAVACPTGASPVGVCNCPNGTPAPVWNAVTRTWTHVCSTAGCGANSVISGGICVCNQGYSGRVNGVGTCTAVACPVGASPLGVCTCPNNGPAPVWNAVTRTWTHICNIQPTATLSTAVVNVNVAQVGVSIPAFLTAVTAPEAGQALTLVCVAGTPAIFSTQPTLTLVGVTATLAFAKLAATTAGTSTVTCTITDNGSPILSTQVTFTVNIGSGGVIPCGTTGGVCTHAAAVQVDVNVNYNAAFLTTTGTTTACTAATPGLFTTQPAISGTGQLTFASGANVGSSLVTCTTRVVGATTGGSTYSFTINIVTVSNQWLRARVTTNPGTLSSAAFQTAITRALATSGITINGIDIKYACPPAACGGTTAAVAVQTLACPGTHALRVAASCVFQFANERQIDTLQAATGSIVDFDIITQQIDNTPAKQAERQTVQTALNAEATRCNAGSTTCAFTQSGVPLVSGSNIALTPIVSDATPIPPPVPTTSSDDSSFPVWGWILIAAGIVLCCCLMVLLYFCCIKKKKNKNKDRELSPYREKEMQGSAPAPYKAADGPTSYSDSYYETSYGSSYVPETFTPGERVRAQYIDGATYDGEIFAEAADGTYNIKWYDGSHSEGVPSNQISRL